MKCNQIFGCKTTLENVSTASGGIHVNVKYCDATHNGIEGIGWSRRCNHPEYGLPG